ncbi:hypothetical protein MMC07_000666 [Pseudocyphellaria aurata]|nr:hypothetical protein [Pseudocyphellaria aurata]
MEKGENFFKDYEFGRNTLRHKFCPKCGSSVMAVKHDAPDGKKIAINARMFHDANLDSLEKASFDGVGLEPVYHAPQVFSNLVAKDGFKIYHGNCHCGAVTYSVQSEPFTETGPPVRECDCSICSRNGYLTIYPRIADVEIHGEDALTGYAFGERTTHKFCSLCGTSLFNYINNPKQDMRCVNIRTLNELDVKRLNIVSNYAPPIVFFED